MVFARFAFVLVPFLAAVGSGQTSPPPPAYTYDVVSIHKSDPASSPHIGNDGPQGGFRAVNCSLLLLIALAYDVAKYQISGAPAWVSSDHFDITLTPETIEAATDPSVSVSADSAHFDRNQQRLRAVLRDRFGLVLRGEMRELPFYRMTVARTGHKLLPHGETKPSIQSSGDTHIAATGVTLDYLTGILSIQLRAPVHDETHITGQFDFKLDWEPDPEPSAIAANLGTGPSIFSAITDQLGLRLESAKGPVQIYVIDRITLPTEN